MKNNAPKGSLGNTAKKMTASVLPSVLAIVAGFLLGFIILLAVNAGDSVAGITTIIKGGFSVRGGFGQVLYFSVPIIMTGLSVGFAFKTGLFNIGASGQFMIGAAVAIWVGIKWTFLPGASHWIVAILMGMIAGAIWGILPGLLKAVCNVNEVITCIMMNYISMSLVNYMIKTIPGLYNGTTNRTNAVHANAVIPSGGLDELFGYRSLNVSLIVAIIFVIIVYIVLNKTTFGYELKACGFNKEAGKYAGINAKRNIVMSMVIAGALSGIGGAMFYLNGSGQLYNVIDEVAAEGFNGIAIALLGLSNPIGIFISAIFISHITVGGFQLQLLNFDNEIIDIIIAAIVYFGAFSLLFKIIVSKIFKDKKAKNANAEDPPADPILIDGPDPLPNVGANLNEPVDAEPTSDEVQVNVEKGGDDQ